MPRIVSRSLSRFALPILLGVQAQAATLLDSLRVSIYRHERVFATAETASERNPSISIVLTSQSPGCGTIAIDSISAKRNPALYDRTLVRLVVSRTSGRSPGCSAWKRQRVIAPLFAGSDTASQVARSQFLHATISSTRIVLAGSRDSLDLPVSASDTGRVHVYGGFVPLPACYPQCISTCQLSPASWGFAFHPVQGGQSAPSGATEMRRRIDSARVVGIRRMGEGVWLPAQPKDMPDSFRVFGNSSSPISVDPMLAFLPAVDRVLRTARRIHWDSISKGDTAGFPAFAVADAWERPWRLILQGGSASGDSIVGDTLRLSGTTAVFEAKPAIPLCLCPTKWPGPVLPAAGTRWLELRYTDRPMPAFSGARPDSGEEWFGLRRDSLFATRGMCESQPSQFVSTLAEAIPSSISLRSPLARAKPHLWRSASGWHLDLPYEVGARVDIDVYSLTGEEILSLRGVSQGRADLGMLHSASGILVVRITGAGFSQSMRLPALR